MLSTTTPPLRVGRFNSPHLVSVNDCISINNESVSSEVYQKARDEVERADKEQAIGTSSFEILTLTALLIFERAQLDVVILEVGMGGRLDATNIISDDCVLVSALTAVDLDHQAFLGTSVSAIAAEKAAIARKGTPFVMGGQSDPDVETVVAKVVSAAGAELLYALPVLERSWDAAIDGPHRHRSPYRHPIRPPAAPPRSVFHGLLRAPGVRVLPLHGEHQLDNLALAVSVVSAVLMNPAWTAVRARFTNATIARGIGCVRWPGRLSFHTLNSPPLLVLADGAHNPASAKTLAAYTLAPLLPVNAPEDVQVDVSTGCRWVKSVPPAELQEVVKSLAPGTETWVDATDGAGELRRALDWAAERRGDRDGLVVLAGSCIL
ncbi:Mur ligase [Mycena olivaceomarginata]|nr:Mur ligase [Mycena olivaceomarginata]